MPTFSHSAAPDSNRYTPKHRLASARQARQRDTDLLPDALAGLNDLDIFSFDDVFPPAGTAGKTDPDDIPYVDVTVARWEDFTGRKAIRVTTP